jgi:hypothetical protein
MNEGEPTMNPVLQRAVDRADVVWDMLLTGKVNVKKANSMTAVIHETVNSAAIALRERIFLADERGKTRTNRGTRKLPAPVQNGAAARPEKCSTK